jgi:HNH endonuclease
MTCYQVGDLPPELAARIDVHPVTGCWVVRPLRIRKGMKPDGYRSMPVPGGGYRACHLVVHELLIGAIPAGHQVDHVFTRGCRFKACCRPDHLEAVTKAVNIARSNACKRLRRLEAMP